MAEENSNSHFNPRCKAQSTSHLLSTDSAMIKSLSSSPSPASSTSSLATSHSSKSNLSTFLKIPLPSRKSTPTPPVEERFVMTIIRSPSVNSQRLSSNSSTDLTRAISPPPPPTPVEDISNNSKFFKNKMTAAFNHMKYRSFSFLVLVDHWISFRLGCTNATEFSNE